MNPTVAAVAKKFWLSTGGYHRALAGTAFPGVAVLSYHGLRDDGWNTGTMAFKNLHVSAETFEAHCRVLRSACNPISLDDWRIASGGGAPLPRRPVLITFDDGYRSVLTIAAPILARYELPAVVFACSEPIRTRRLLWFDFVAATAGEREVEAWKSSSYDDWAAACAVGAAVGEDDPRALMTAQEVAALARQPGIEVGAHTARHAVLSRGSAAQQRAEIATCRDDLARWTGRPVRAFAYPNGRVGIDYTPETVGIVASLDFDAAFTTHAAFSTADEPPLERSRFTLVSEVTAAELAHRLAYTWPR